MAPTTRLSDAIHAQKYRGEGENFEQSMYRIAGALKDSDEHFHSLKDILIEQRFLPAGRVQSAVGSPRQVTAINCYVSGTIEDSMASIMLRATQAAETMRMGGGIGYDFSNIRPRGTLIKTLESKASGPVSFMRIYDAVCQTIASAGHRRGAQMGVLRIDHPDVEEFIHCKQNSTALTGFNISLGVTHEFMRHLDSGAPFPLRWEGNIYKYIDPVNLWEMIMRSTWDYAEPGVLFIDTINDYNNLWYCEKIAASNPCGEQPLPPYGACLLGSFNLVKYITPSKSFDFDLLIRDIPHVVRAMDNVVDVTIYPLPEQRHEEETKRRMGLGVTGLANALETMGHSYGSPEFLRLQEKILQTIAIGSYRASMALAREKGPFPMFDAPKYMMGRHLMHLASSDGELMRDLWTHGIRNSHLTSIAPTGTISLCADNVSSGIEPVFSYSAQRTIQAFDGPITETVEDYAFREWGTRGKISSDCTSEDHLNVLKIASRWVDSAVSKTCNVSPSMPWDAFKNIYTDAYKAGCKGVTTFNPGGKRMGILIADDEPKVEACYYDPDTGTRSCD